MLTAEIRWFYDGSSSFRSLEGFLPFSESNERTDHYLLGADDRLGIKWREGTIEIKQQQGVAQDYQKGVLAGKIEIWRKWSFDLEDRTAYPDELAAPHWLPVQKNRKLARLSYDEEQQTTTPLHPGKDGERVCEVEITQIQVADQTYCTVGLEASGASSSLRENLKATIDYLIKSGNLEGLDLTIGGSNNYARWIQEKFSNKLPNNEYFGDS